MWMSAEHWYKKRDLGNFYYCMCLKAFANVIGTFWGGDTPSLHGIKNYKMSFNDIC